MKKVCIVFPYPMGEDFLSGGVSKLIVANIEAVKEYYEVCLIAPVNNDGLVQYMKAHYPNVKVKLVDFLTLQRYVDNKNMLERVLSVGKRVFQTLLTNKNIKKAIAEEKPDIVHFHGEVTFSYLKYGKETGAGTIFHTSCFRFSKPEILRKLVVNGAYKNSDLIISTTKSISALFGNNPANVVIPNPIITVDATGKTTSGSLEEEYIGYDGLKLLFVGRICKVKQIHYMVQALTKLTDDERKKVKFFVIGKPNHEMDQVYFDDIKKYIAEHHLEESVTFLGYKNNVDAYLKKADVGVLISESEAISMAGIEYLFNSVPIIGFDNPGINELISDNVSGFLVKDGDVDGLAACIRRFFDKDKLADMKKNAYEEAVNNYSMQAFQNKILMYYKKIQK